MQKLMDVYATVLNETFGAEIDFAAPVFTDDIARYYAVSNFKTIAELRDYITTYVEEDLIDGETSFKEDFIEKDGQLLAVRGGKGYGYYAIDPNSWKMDGETSALVQFMLFDAVQEGGFLKLDFGQKNGMWKVVSATLPEGF